MVREKIITLHREAIRHEQELESLRYNTWSLSKERTQELIKFHQNRIIECDKEINQLTQKISKNYCN